MLLESVQRIRDRPPGRREAFDKARAHGGGASRSAHIRGTHVPGGGAVHSINKRHHSMRVSDRLIVPATFPAAASRAVGDPEMSCRGAAAPGAAPHSPSKC